MKYCEPCICDLASKILYKDCSIDELFEMCLKYFDTTREYIMKANRKRERVLIRQMCMTAIRDNTKHGIVSLKMIGHYFGGKDHTTVIHAKQTIQDLCDTDEDIKHNYDNLFNFIQNERINKTNRRN